MKKNKAELIITNKELTYQNKEKKEKQTQELVIITKNLYIKAIEKENRLLNWLLQNKELVFKIKKKQNRLQVIIANKELTSK
jgi:hypothetical protein